MARLFFGALCFFLAASAQAQQVQPMPGAAPRASPAPSSAASSSHFPASAPRRPTPAVAPIAVPPIVVTPSAVPGANLPPPPVQVPRPPVITGCDGSGCWDSQGARWNNMGPTMTGPRGTCSVHNGALQCP